jgi:hypothetical protein
VAPRYSGYDAGMEGYEVISVANDERLGSVVRAENGYIVVERGTFRKHRYAIPLTTVEVDEDAREVRTSLSKELIEDSPEVGDEGLDRESLARHYGEPDSSGAAVQERVETREGDRGDRPGGIPRESPGMLGERYSDADVPPDR